jgi:hypothetical protein
VRSPFYFGFGLGSGGGGYTIEGDHVGFAAHHDEVLRADAWAFPFAWQLEAGATVSPTLLVGGEVSGFVSHADELEGESTLTTGQLLAVLTWFPAERGPFLRGGAGFGWMSSRVYEAGFVSSDAVGGLGILGGFGWAWWLGRQFNLTLHADVWGHEYANHFDQPDRAAGVNAYLGFRWY